MGGEVVEANDGAAATGRVGIFEYRPALDGLRAIAVLLVLVYHNDLYPLRSTRVLRGGFLGVDVFFVLSGYLITSLLLIEHRRGNGIAIRAFWARRIRRLFPALCVMLLIVALYAQVIAAPQDLARIRGDSLATLFYVQNWHMILGDRGGSILAHAWSLSVEEQWYLVWPAAMVALLAWSRARRIRMSVVMGVVALVAAAWTLVVANLGGIGHAYLGTDTRAQELLVGAALACLLHERALGTTGPRQVFQVGLLGAAVVVGFVATAPTPSSSFLTRGGYFVFAIAVAAVVAAAVQPSNPVVGVLSYRPLRAVGLISYGVYLYHWPLYFFLTPERVHVSGVALLGVRVVATLVLATVSYFVVERPVRHGSRLGARPFLFAPVAVVVVLATILVVTRQPPVPTLISAESMAFYSRTGASARGTRVLVIGEARAFQLQFLGGTYARPDVTGLAVGFLDCGLVAGDIQLPTGPLPEARHCARRLAALQDVAAAFRPDVIVLMPEDQELFNRHADGNTYVLGTRPWADYVTDQIDAARHALTAVHPAPTLLVTVPCGYAPTGRPALDKVLSSPNRRKILNQLVHSYAKAHADTVAVSDPATATCTGAPATTALTRASAEQLWSWLIPRALTAATTAHG